MAGVVVCMCNGLSGLEGDDVMVGVARRVIIS